MDALSPFIKTFFEAIKPLNLALQDPVQMQLLIRATGREIHFTNTELGGLLSSNGALYNVATTVAGLINDGDDLLDDLESDNSATRSQAVIDLSTTIADLGVQIVRLGDEVQSINLNALDLPNELKDPQFWLDFANELPEWLLLEYLEQEVPVVYSLLLALGVIEEDEANNTRQLKIEVVGDILTDPLGSIKNLYQWGSNTFDYEKLQDILLSALMGLDLPLSLRPARPSLANQYLTNINKTIYELDIPFVQGITADGFVNAGLIVMPVPEQTGGAINGFLLTNLTYGSFSKDIEINDTWTLKINAELDQTGIKGIRVHPNQVYPHGDVGETEATISLLGKPVDETGNSTNWLMLGGRESTRMEVGELELLAGFRAVGNDHDLRLAAYIRDFIIVLSPTDADSFLSSLLGSLDVDAHLNVNIEWSSQTGFSIGGNAKPDIVIPIDKSLGPVLIDSFRLSAGNAEEQTGSKLSTGLTWSVNLGPFSLLVEDMGLDFETTKNIDNTGNLGALNVKVGFLPPSGVGFNVDEKATGGAVSGGGYLKFEKEIGRYSGALSIDILEVGMTAFGVLDTLLPDNPNDWALFFSLTFDFPGLPLGFGFTLEGVGGLVCINRTMDTYALADGLKEGVLDDLMFPDDVLADAANILQQVDSNFPIAVDNYVFGPIVQIGWGPKTIITGELGVLLSLPDGIFAVIGSLSSVLPDPENELLSLHMDVLGVIDTAEQTVLVVASLYDSRLLSTIELSGDMALYGRASGTPYFLLSVGGYHPSFQPPGDLPATVLDLRRMSARISLSEDVFISVESYFAVTSNTVQYGAGLTLEASHKFLGVVYTAKGEFGFNVLIVFTPFALITDLKASVGVYAKNDELMGVDLEVHLEGPKPWYATGRAEFKFLGIKVKLKVEVGGKQLPAPREPFDVEAEVITALKDSNSWSALASNSFVANAVTLAEMEQGEESDEPLVWARPDDTIEVRQNVCPLNREIDVYGQYTPLGADKIELKSVTLDNSEGDDLKVDWEHITDWFAPAQYDDISDSKKLSSPSYEEMVAGVVFGTDTVSKTRPDKEDENIRSVITDWEEKIIEGDQTIFIGKKPNIINLQQSILQTNFYSSSNTSYQTGSVNINTGKEPVTLIETSFDVNENRYSIVTSDTAEIAKTHTNRNANQSGMSYSNALRLLNKEIALDKKNISELRIAPVHAVNTGVKKKQEVET